MVDGWKEVIWVWGCDYACFIECMIEDVLSCRHLGVLGLLKGMAFVLGGRAAFRWCSRICLRYGVSGAGGT